MTIEKYLGDIERRHNNQPSSSDTTYEVSVLSGNTDDFNSISDSPGSDNVRRSAPTLAI